MAAQIPAPVGSPRHLGLTLERIAAALDTLVEQTAPTDPAPAAAADTRAIVRPAVVETPVTLVHDPVVDEAVAASRPARKRASRSTKAAA